MVVDILRFLSYVKCFSITLTPNKTDAAAISCPSEWSLKPKGIP